MIGSMFRRVESLEQKLHGRHANLAERIRRFLRFAESADAGPDERRRAEELTALVRTAIARKQAAEAGRRR